MKTGFNNLIEDNSDQKFNIIATICHFTENALKTATHFVEHCKRNAITKEDIKRALIMEVFIFGKRGTEMNDIIKIKDDIVKHANDDDDDANIDDLIMDDDKINPFADSSCNCALCSHINNIYDKWNVFQPITDIDKIMKKHIDEMDKDNSWYSESDSEDDEFTESDDSQ